VVVGCPSYRKKKKKDPNPDSKVPKPKQSHLLLNDTSDNAVIDDLVALGEESEDAEY